MTDLERRIRDALDDEARSAPPPHEVAPAVRRARRRQVAIVAGTLLGVIALAAASILGVRTVLTGGDGTPASAPVVTSTMNGISITHPETWHVIDPDEAGLNGPADQTRTFPRIVLALSPIDAGDLLGCPGLAEDTAPTFLMTVQEEPLALSGDASAPWPVGLEPMDVGTSGSGCYPSWEFLRAGWTAAGRTFEARIGLAPDVSDEDREALEAAFASMTFEPADGLAPSVVLSTGTAGGERWELIAAPEAAGLSLTLQGETFGTGLSVIDAGTEDLQLLDHVFGTGAGAARVVFAALPADVVRVVALDAGLPPVDVDVVDVPGQIDARLNAFVYEIPADRIVSFEAYDARGELVASGDPLRPVGPTNEIDVIWARLFRAESSVPDYAAQHGGSLVGFDAEAAARIDPGIGGALGTGWTDGSPQEGQVGIVGVTAGSLVLVSLTGAGDAYCIAATVDPQGDVTFGYGQQLARSVADCHGGW